VNNAGEGHDRSLGCRPPAVRFNPIGNLEVAANVAGGVRVAGWALDPDTAAPVALEGWVDGRNGDDGGHRVGTLKADVDRPEGGWGTTYVGYGNAHGFAGVVSAEPLRDTVCVYAINTGAGDANTATVKVSIRATDSRPPNVTYSLLTPRRSTIRMDPQLNGRSTGRGVARLNVSNCDRPSHSDQYSMRSGSKWHSVG
jgi:hypothetical protein